MSQPSSPFLVQEPRPIPPDEVATELAHLWQEMTASLGGLMLRARALTFVAFTADPDRRGELQEMLVAVSQDHPSRAILLVAREGEEPELETWASIQCLRPPDGEENPAICTEQVIIEATPSALDRVTSLVLALTVPDIPVVVWWVGDPTPRQSPFEALFQLADLFILDATSFRAPFRSIRHEARLKARGGRRTVVTDLAWHFLAEWREHVAQLFDAPEWAAHLPDVRRVRVEFSSPPNTNLIVAPAFFMAGWIASRLKWQPVSAHPLRGQATYELSFEAMSGPATVNIRPVKATTHGPGELITVELETRDPVPLHFRLSRVDRTQCIDVIVEQDMTTLFHHVAAWQSLTLPEHLTRVILYTRRDRAFAETLRTLAPLAEELAEPGESSS